MAQTLTEIQRTLLGIIVAVESGVTTPEEAVDELNKLKAKAAKAGLNFRADYLLADFQEIRKNSISSYESSTYVEPVYESSSSSY
jgi:hypothetical protein